MIHFVVDFTQFVNVVDGVNIRFFIYFITFYKYFTPYSCIYEKLFYICVCLIRKAHFQTNFLNKLN